MIVRCKHVKKGDGGVVDGCGWQGEHPGLARCPRCGSVFLRPLEKTAMKPGYEPKYLLGEMGQICEEAGEVLKHFGKILRFGIDNIYIPDGDDNHKVESNREAFYRELDDLEACIKRIKARNAAKPEEPLGPVTDEQHSPYIDLAQSAQEYLELSEAAKSVSVEGVTKRGRLREAHRKLNALVGRALGRDA